MGFRVLGPAFVLLSLIGVPVTSGQPGCEVVRDPASLAARLAWHGMSAGMIVGMPPLPDVALRRLFETLDVVHYPFGAWMSLCDVDHSSGFAKGATPQSVFEDHIKTHPGARLDADGKANGSPIPVLRTEEGNICHAALQRRTREAHTSRSLWDLAGNLVTDATVSKPPPGRIGACLGAHEVSPVPRTIGAGVTLETALNSLAAQFEGTVWVAVETAEGRCAIGLLTTRESGGVCMGAVGRPW